MSETILIDRGLTVTQFQRRGRFRLLEEYQPDLVLLT
jgi:hypothetical protein